jgi:hypothetical protein
VRHLLTSLGIEELARASSDLKRVVALRAQRGEVAGRMNELEGLWSSGEFSTPNYKKQLAALSATLAGIDASLSEIEAENAFAGLLTSTVGILKDAFGHTVQMGERFDALSLDQRRTIIRTLLPTIVIRKGTGNRVEAFDREGKRIELTDDKYATV